MMRFTERLESIRHVWLLVISFVMVPLLGLVEYMGGPYVSFPVFYLLPVALASWYAGWGWGAITCIASTVAMVISGLETGYHPDPLYVVWSSVVRALVFFIMSYMLAALRVALNNERELARKDALTGCGNRRLFMEVAAAEINRAMRYPHPFTLAYIDVDDFKGVNDTAGHSGGDALLKHLCERIMQDIRQVDTLARLGGDEFAVLFPEVGFEAAQVIGQRLDKNLREAFKIAGKQITFSIGIVTFDVAPHDVDEMLKTADALMYAVKASGKNRFQHQLVG